MKLATAGIHGDEQTAVSRAVAAPISVSTIFKYPENVRNMHEGGPDLTVDGASFYYSRMGQPNSVKVEAVFGSVCEGEAVLYSSGLSAFHGAMLYYNPKRVFIGDAYHGCHAILKIMNRNYGTQVLPLDSDPALIEKGDVVHVETPLNPYGTANNIEYYAKLAHARGAYLIVDSTFGPPPLQQPFELGADLIMHSATKFFGGHSDLLAGLLISKDPKVKKALVSDRDVMGTIAGSLETWLLLRSMRSYKVRIIQQAASANAIVKYLVDHQAELPKLAKVYHSSLQTDSYLPKQMPKGGSPVFSIECVDKQSARQLPAALKWFTHATSLGGAESLIEWRSISDIRTSETLLRVSIGLEDTQDLIDDLVQALS